MKSELLYSLVRLITPVKIDPKSKLPAGWEIVPGQNIPKTVPATADGIQRLSLRFNNIQS